MIHVHVLSYNVARGVRFSVSKLYFLLWNLIKKKNEKKKHARLRTTSRERPRTYFDMTDRFFHVGFLARTKKRTFGNKKKANRQTRSRTICLCDVIETINQMSSFVVPMIGRADTRTRTHTDDTRTTRTTRSPDAVCGAPQRSLRFCLASVFEIMQKPLRSSTLL